MLTDTDDADADDVAFLNEAPPSSRSAPDSFGREWSTFDERSLVRAVDAVQQLGRRFVLGDVGGCTRTLLFSDTALGRSTASFIHSHTNLAGNTHSVHHTPYRTQFIPLTLLHFTHHLLRCIISCDAFNVPVNLLVSLPAV